MATMPPIPGDLDPFARSWGVSSVWGSELWDM